MNQFSTPILPTGRPVGRRAFMLGGLGLSAAALAACTSPPSGSGGSGGSGTLAIQDSFSLPEGHALLQSYAEEFMSENPGVTISVTAVPWDNHRATVLAALSSQSLPDIIHSTSAFGSVEFSQLGAFIDLADLMDPALKENFVATAFDEIGTLGLPLNASPEQGIWYLKDAFESAGITPPPVEEAWPWEEMISNAQKLTGDGRWGFVERGAAAVMPKSIIPYGWSFGGDFITGSEGSWAASANTPEMVSGIQMMVDLTRVHEVRPESYLNWALAEAQRAWADDEMAMFSSGMWWPGNADTVSDRRFGKDYDVMLFPTDDPANRAVYTGYDYLHVSRDCQDPELAMRFLTWVYQKENLVPLAQANLNLPPLTLDALEDEAYSEENYPVWATRYSKWIDLQRNSSTNPHYTSTMSNLVVPAMQGLVQSGDSVQDALDGLNTQIEAELAG